MSSQTPVFERIRRDFCERHKRPYEPGFWCVECEYEATKGAGEKKIMNAISESDPNKGGTLIKKSWSNSGKAPGGKSGA